MTTKAEQVHKDAVAALGCLICYLESGILGTPANLHHTKTGMGAGQRNDDWHVLPLCPRHHQTGGWGVAYHAGPREWQRRYGTETQLLETVNVLLERENIA